MLFIPAYLPSIHFLHALRKHPTPQFCLHGFYEKQTYRNRCTIYGANGRLDLTVPIVHSHNGKRQTDQMIKIHHAENWQKNHWKSLESAYRSSAYFEFYEDELLEVYKQKHSGLMEMNLAFIALFFTWLEEPFAPEFHASYTPLTDESSALLNAKTKYPKKTPAYAQVFETKYGFIPQLSCLDLFFNLGPETKSYLNTLD